MLGRKRWTSNRPCGWKSRSRLSVAVVRRRIVTIEKRPRWERKIGDGVPVVEAFHIGPVLFGLRHRTARGCSKRDLTFESLRQRLVAIALFTSNDAAIRQRNPNR